MTRLVLLALVLALAGPAFAQTPAAARAAGVQVHRLEIRDGTVYHDGAALPEGALPTGLNVEGMNMSFEYSGPVAPALGIGGRLYTLDGDRLVELDRAEVEQQAFAFTKPQPLGRSAAEQAQEAYLRGLSERDRALYERILREREMEAEAIRIARRIRQMPAGTDRAALRADLREKVEAMFELKQENRRDEIRQVKDVLNGLQGRLQEREAMRDEIIDHRLRELTGQ